MIDNKPPQHSNAPSESFPRFMDERAVSELLGVPCATLQRWRFSGDGPAYYKFGRAVRYAVSDIEEYIYEKRMV